MLSNNINTTSAAARITLLSALLAGLISCSFQEYIAKPIDHKAITEKYLNRQVNDLQFQQYLISNGYRPETLPIQKWTSDDLIYCALFFNPSLNIARAQWRSAEAARMTASDWKLPTFNTKYGKSNNANDEISPYTYTLSIDLPIETAKKRNIRIESAAHLSEAAKLRIAQAAWQLRVETLRALHEYQFNQHLLDLLSKEQALRQQIVSIFEKRISFGESSSTELSKANLLLQEITTVLHSKQRYQVVLLAKLANSLGISPQKLEEMQLSDALDSDKLMAQPLPNQGKDLQSEALLNRLDIRIALERYAVAEAKVKLEIAKQYPDMVLSPNHTYEFGNRIWSLGLSGIMTFITKNKMAIAEAKELREVEAAQFEALQASVISEVHTAKARLAQAHNMRNDQKILLSQQKNNTQRIESKLRSGEADRLELSYAKLEELITQKNYALTNYQLTTAINDLESVIQAPLAESLLTSEKLETLSTR